MADPLLLLRRVRTRSPLPAAPSPVPPPLPPVPVPVALPPAAAAATTATASPRCKRGRRRRFYPPQRVYRTRSSFLELSEEQVLRRYRLDKAAIAGLCRELGADLQSLTGRSHALPVAVKVTSALTFLASGSFQTATREATGISQSAMSNCLAQFLEALTRRATRYITFPTAAAAASTGTTAAPSAFPGVLGLLGTMHVALRAPSENEPAFRNGGNFHSLNMQLVVDGAGAITNVVAKFPGSCPNAAVLERSALARLLEGARPRGAWLLGDASYPLKPWLMTPIPRPRGPAEVRYNVLHRGAMRPLRRTRRLLRRRFRCLGPPRPGVAEGGTDADGDAPNCWGGGPLQYAPPKVCQIFLACCILHNIALRRRMPLEPPEVGGATPPETPPGAVTPPEADADAELLPPPPAALGPPGYVSSEARAVRARIVQHVKEGLH